MAPKLRVTEHIHQADPEIGDTYVVVAIDPGNRVFELEPWTPPPVASVVRRTKRASNGE